MMALPLMSLPASARGMQAACSADTQTMLEALGHKIGRSVTFVLITEGHHKLWMSSMGIRRWKTFRSLLCSCRRGILQFIIAHAKPSLRMRSVQHHCTQSSTCAHI